MALFSDKLNDKSVAIIGLGGLGGFIAEALSRLDLKRLVLVDGDIFSPSNLNRQLFCNYDTLGKSKAEVTKQAISKHSKCEIVAIPHFLDQNNGADILKNVDLAIDALDNVSTRLLLESLCEHKNIPLVHGAIDVFFGTVAVIFPQDKTLSLYYSNVKEIASGETVSYVPAIIANIEVALAVKILTGQPLPIGKNQLMLIDTESFSINVVSV